MITTALMILSPMPAYIAELRVDSARSAFRQCLSIQAESMEAVEIGPDNLVDLARSACYVLEKDLRATLLPLAERQLIKHGAKHYSEDVIDLLADQTLKALVDEDLATLREAAATRKPAR